MLGSKAFAQSRLGRDSAVGHPFRQAQRPRRIDRARTSIRRPGARMVTTMANELARTGKQTALLGICAAGGLGAAAVLERVE